MSRHRLLLIVVVVLTLLVSCSPTSASKPKVLFILQESSESMNFVLKNEVSVMADMVKNAGFDVVYATSSGKSLGTADIVITPDLKLADVNVNDYVGLVLPCMVVGVDRPASPETDKIVAEMAAAGKPIESASGAIFSLRNAGVLEGKQFATTEQDASSITEGKYMGTGVVQDGNLITSGVCPYAQLLGVGKDETVELTQKFIDALKTAA